VPLGVVLVIGPSNYPLFLPGVQALQALAAGNAAVLKPGRLGAGPARALSESLVRSGLDPRLAPVLEEDPRAAREAIDAGVDKVVLTGSAATGASLLGELAPRGIPAVVELSGCDAVFVLEDADLERAARALAFGLGLNGGATCIAPRRVFVARSRASDLERLLVARAERLPPRAVDPGPAALLARLGGEAIRSGARVAAGSLDPAPSMRPVVLADAQPSMGLLREDVFAPVISLVAVDGPEQALAAAGACPYALGASIFGSERTARELAARVQAGFVTINDLIVPTADPRLPFGGRRRSGFGVTRGGEGLLEMTAVKAISARRGRLAPHLDGARDSDAGLFRAWLRAAHGRGARERFAGLVSLVRAAAARPGTRRDTEGHRR
jgi:acyl-CoA reductase-like NAD-dependent aldehyde dehydrogenase